MERHILVIRCLHLVLFSAWHVATIDEDGVLVAWNVTKIPSFLPSNLSPSLPLHGANCSYKRRRPFDYNVWYCTGDKLTTVPENLTFTSTPMSLMLEDTGIEILRKDSLTPYAGILRELYLINVLKFHTFIPGIFENTIQLQTIYINVAPSLTYIHVDVFKAHLPKLKIIRILRTALVALPYLGNLITNNILRTVDLENNKIRRIGTACVRIKSIELILNYNNITSVDSMAFNGSEIAKLSLKGNPELTSIHTDAFVGLASIQYLDLSDTAITSLPTKGLRNLGVLKIEDTKTLKTFPSIYKFDSITEAHLTYPYHCCAFKFPDKHDPEMYKMHEELERRSKMDCASISGNSSSYRSNDLYPSSGELILSETVAPPRAKLNITCGTISKAYYKDVICFPKPDAFNPCEDIMGYWGLRIAVWLVAILAIVGNLAVLIVLVFPRVEMTVPKFLMCNLAFADICMGIYLTLVAGMDARSIGEYFNYAIDWQNGPGCQVAGFLTVFSTELSIFTLTIITCERWYTITYAIYLNRRLGLKTSAKIMVVGWIYSCIMACLPLFDISGYAKTSICLPLTRRDIRDLVYLITLLVFNGLAFLMIVACYGHMYSTIRAGREEVTPMARSDTTVAKRMALLVFTDFVCWAPIAFFGITTLAGQLLINVTQTKILLVFVYPLNSCANPYLYALLTQQYRCDLCVVLDRLGMCKGRAAKYKNEAGGHFAAATTGERINGRRSDVRHNSALRTSSSNSTAPVGITNDSLGEAREFHTVRQDRVGDTGRCSTTTA